MKKILVIDDNRMFRFMLAEWLKAEGYYPITAEDGIEGVQLARLHNPVLIFCDFNMPQLNGIEVLKQLQNDLYTSHIPFFFITSESHLKPRIVKQPGVNGVILKGGEIEELRQALTAIEAQKPM